MQTHSRQEARACLSCGTNFVAYICWNKRYCSRPCAFLGRPSKPKRPIADRFWPKVDKSDGCWEWRGTKVGSGYGMIHAGYGHLMVPANRAAWFIATGQWPPGNGDIGHTCDNPGCVRNDDVGTYDVDGVLYPRIGHLWLSTTSANARDMVLKGRKRGGRVPKHG